jgi:hypothetical protein
MQCTYAKTTQRKNSYPNFDHLHPAPLQLALALALDSKTHKERNDIIWSLLDAGAAMKRTTDPSMSKIIASFGKLPIPKKKKQWACLEKVIEAENADPKKVYLDIYKRAAEANNLNALNYLCSFYDHYLDPLHCAILDHLHLKTSADEITALFQDNNKEKTRVTLTAQDLDGYTPIQVAANKGKWDVVKAIAETQSTDSKDQAKYGLTLLQAMASKEYDAATALIKAGAPPWHVYASSFAREDRPDSDYNEANLARHRVYLKHNTKKELYGCGAVHLAVQAGKLELVKLLLHHKANPSMQCTYAKTTQRKNSYPNFDHLHPAPLQLALALDSKTHKERNDIIWSLLDAGAAMKRTTDPSMSKIIASFSQLPIPKNKEQWAYLEKVINNAEKPTKPQTYLRFYRAAVEQKNTTAQAFLLKVIPDSLALHCALISDNLEKAQTIFTKCKTKEDIHLTIKDERGYSSQDGANFD